MYDAERRARDRGRRRDGLFLRALVAFLVLPGTVGFLIPLALIQPGQRVPALTLYAAGVMIAFQLRIVFGEEPSLAQAFGPEWARYRSRVRRWL